MPIVETKRIITFTKEEKELINKMIEMVGNIDCSKMDIPCDKCPFGSICDYGCADTVEKRINKLLNN